MEVAGMEQKGMENKMKTGFIIEGTIKLRNERADGSIVETVQKNLVVRWGLEQVASLLAGNSMPAGMITHLALGDNNTPPIDGDTHLGNELTRAAATITQLSGAESNKIEYRVVYATGAVAGTFKEAGLFDADTIGNMFNRSVFADFPVSVADTLTIIWIVEVKNV